MDAIALTRLRRRQGEVCARPHAFCPPARRAACSCPAPVSSGSLVSLRVHVRCCPKVAGDERRAIRLR
eukprot:1562819-Pleurochrysis_carterae.AAC.2